MKRDFGSCMLYALFGLPIFLLLFIAGLYIGNCGFNAECSGLPQPPIIHTPIPTMIPASLPNPAGGGQLSSRAVCRVSARDLLATWVAAGSTESQQFGFLDVNGNVCNGTFADVMPIFSQPDLWYQGALACDACHNSNLTVASGYLDLSSYAGILAGGKRIPPANQGEDILGGGVWENSLLYKVLFVEKTMPFGAPTGAVAADGPIFPAGSLAVLPTPGPTEKPSGEEVARPHAPGGAGDAINLPGNPVAGQQVFVDHCQICHGLEGMDNVPNPGSDDGTVPPLNPIDSTLVSVDYTTFAYNLDLFLENGSLPEGPNAAFQMPAWGKLAILTQQQIADVIAYIISVNPVP